MSGILSGWDSLDPALRWLLRINLVALTAATLVFLSEAGVGGGVAPRA